MQIKRYGDLKIGNRFQFMPTETRDDIEPEATYTVVEPKTPGSAPEARISLCRPRVFVPAHMQVILISSD